MEILLDIEDERWQSVLPDVEMFTHRVLQSAAGKGMLDPFHARIFEVSILLTDDAAMQVLNRNFRGKDKPTNVLSFPGFEELDKDVEVAMLGDIALGFETLQREAAEQGKALKDHYAHLLLHGFLHLLGYDHEDEDEAKAMEAIEISLLQQLGIGNPYHINDPATKS